MRPQHTKKCDILIVGCGLSGAVIARELAEKQGLHCLILEKRAHIAGNCFDQTDQTGVLIHQYGPHYFRTNSEEVKTFLSRFTEWRPVNYQILAHTAGRYWSFPINLNTFEELQGLPKGSATSEEMREALDAWRIPFQSPKNSEEVILNKVGPELYKKFFYHYTCKQWGCTPSELDAEVCARIPIRLNRDDRYLQDRFQAIPKDGYTKMVEKILDHEKIEVQLETDFFEQKDLITRRHTVYTGMIDQYFGHQFGPLPYRSLRFEWEHHEKEWAQPAVQINYPGPEPFTRTVEIKHVTGQKINRTTVSREFPQDYQPGREAYYPVPAPKAKEVYLQYAHLAKKEPHTTFFGRLASYRYYNMDQIVALALKEATKITEKFPCKR